MAVPIIFFVHGETSFLDANIAYFDFENQDNYQLYCSEQNPDPYFLADKRENIITMQCGHYIHKKMLLIHMFPSFPMWCDNNCLNNESNNYELCSKCQSNCIFVCDMCSNHLSEPITIIDILKNSINNGIDNIIENIIKYKYINRLEDRKRKFDDSNDNLEHKKFN
jgi:hypothetical protein